MLPRQVIPLISYNGKEITEDIAPYLIGLSYTDNISGSADDISITLEDRKGIWISDWFPDRGATLDISIVTRNWGKPEIETLPLGLFSIDTIEASSMPSKVELKAVSIPENNEIRGVDRTRSWEKAELKTIANDVAKGAGMTLVYDTEENPVIVRAEQTEQSDLSFLLKLCEDYGLALKICQNQVVIFDESAYEQIEPQITIVKPGKIYNYQKGMRYIDGITGWRMSAVTRDIYKTCHVQCNDSESGENIEATFTDHNKKEGKTLEVKEQVKTIAEAERLAKKRLREKNSEEWSISLDLMGDTSLLAGMTVYVTGFGKFDSKYIITTARHDIGNGYTTSIDMRRCLDGY